MSLKPKSLKAFDPAAYLSDAESVAVYLEDMMESGNPALFVDALGVVARSKGMTEVAKKAGVGRQSLYKSLRKDGKPEFLTVLKILAALGLQLSVQPAPKAVARPRGVPRGSRRVAA